MKRREFITLLGGAAAAWPVVARAQQAGKIYRILVTSAEEATLAAKRATTRIPIVMMNVSDPVGQGIVASLAHPAGNITGGTQDDSAEVAAKRVQLLKDALPQTARLYHLHNGVNRDLLGR